MTRNIAKVALKMPAPALDPAVRDSTPRPQPASDEAAPVASHVHELQDLLVRRLDMPAPRKWSARASAGFVLLVCGGFWTAVILAIRLLIH